MENLWKVRMTSFVYGFLSLLGSAVVAVLLSEQFRALVFSHFGNSFFAALVMLFVPEIVKHLRNVAKLGKFGVQESSDNFLI